MHHRDLQFGPIHSKPTTPDTHPIACLGGPTSKTMRHHLMSEAMPAKACVNREDYADSHQAAPSKRVIIDPNLRVLQNKPVIV